MKNNPFLAAFLLLIIPVSFLAAPTAVVPLPTGLINGNNLCYMNALITCLHDLTPFRRSVYEHYEESEMNRAFAGVFARKQLNTLPAISLENDLIPAIKLMNPAWRFGNFQDIDEFFKMIFPFFSAAVQNSIGYDSKEVLSAEGDGYLIRDGPPIRNPMIHVNLPEIASKEALNLHALIINALTQPESREYKISRDDHPKYFEQNGIYPFTYDLDIQIQARTEVISYSSVIPVFIARRTRLTGSNSRDFRKDFVHVHEFLRLPLPNGQVEEFTLINFAVYHPGHYYAYSKSFPHLVWHEFNDAEVTRFQRDKDIEALGEELNKNAVMLFYVRRGASAHTDIPEQISNYATQSMVIQHMNHRLNNRISKKLDKSKTKHKKK